MIQASSLTTAQAGAGTAMPVDAWDAVLARDTRRDGDFVYAVRTTRVYCRPTCPSRRPLRTNVLFFATPDAAEGAGYRECRRCRPRRRRTPAERAVERVRRRIETNADSPLTLETLAGEVGLSPFHLQRTFKRLTGVSPKEYANRCRAERFKARLKRGDTVSRATYEAGYGSSSRAYEMSVAQMGMTPAAYRRGGSGMRIRFAVASCSFGRVLVGATDRGVCAVSLGDNDEALETALRNEYPRAELVRDDGPHGDWVRSVVRVLEDGASADVPLDVSGTAFQCRVWKALREIPPGDTRTYAEIATRLGSPNGARAVAGACASNRVALLIPCHRVVRGDGQLGGYRWGLERKERLLRQEREAR